MLKLAFQYMRYYKSQTMAIFFSIFLTAALLSSIGSLMYSSQLNETENNRKIYGDWHYALPLNPQVLKSIKKEYKEQGFSLEQYGVKEMRGKITFPYEITFVWGDNSYLKMTDRELVKGSYPANPGEIAADKFTLSNLGYKGEPGEMITLEGRNYTLTGILKSPWAMDFDQMEIFVSKNFKSADSISTLYVKFREKGKLYQQLYAFLDCCKISGNEVENNDKVTKYLGGEEPESLYHILKFALTDEKGNFTYIVLKLQAEYNLAFYGMVLLLCVFSLCVIYSIFQISVSKRISQYGIMETLGIGGSALGGTLLAELWMLFLLGYPSGCFIGNGILKLFYRNLAGVFTNLSPSPKAGDVFFTEVFSPKADIETPQFHTAYPVMFTGFLFLFFAIFLIGVFTLRSLKKQTLRQAMAGDPSVLKGRRKIYSKRNRNLAGVVVRKFMFSNRKKVTGILLSLSMGGCIFLCTTYMVENLKIHAEMSLKSDDGLGSPYQIFLKSNLPGDTIPEETVEKIRELPQLARIHATKYIPSELTIKKPELEWEEYFDEQNKDSYFRERYGGICVGRGNDYGIKYNVYGYDSSLISQLKDFLLEGEISEKDFEKGNKIIAVANQDGQGNFNFYGKHPGDTILLKVPKKLDDGEILKFNTPQEDYLEMEFELAAIVSRPLAQENRFFNVNGWKNHPSLILSNPQMETLFHITDYSFMDIEPVLGADDTFSDALLQAIRDVPRAVLKDYRKAIQTRKNYLGQQHLFFTGIAVIFLAISLFHIMNSVNHSILSHRREYGIIRAMGITDSGFYRMVLGAGISYGIFTDVFIFLLYHIFLRRFMDYYMAHVLKFLHFTAAVPMGILGMVFVLNLFVSLIAVMIPAGKILKAGVIENL